ncbi:SKIV2 Helicase, partial [Rhinopomastus cyanomelas]|nr:SKIV2 Helicase [Rhinopomastus cyanomelas]
SLPLLDPLGGVLDLRDPDSIEVATRVRELATSLGGFVCTRSPRFTNLYSQFAARQQLLDELEQLQFQLSEQSLQLLPDYGRHLQVGGFPVPPSIPIFP